MKINKVTGKQNQTFDGKCFTVENGKIDCKSTNQ